MRASAFLLCALLVQLVAGPAAAQQPPGAGSLDWYYQHAQEAIAAENYEKATRIIEEAKQRFPEAGHLNLLLADLYYDKELYGLALEEYQQARSKQGEDFLLLNQIARCYGHLNREQEAVAAFEHLLELHPDSLATIDDLGWMYFKTHQLEKAERLLQAALRDHGPDRGIYMTLGTIYSGLYDYENARRYYLRAIEEARGAEDDYFVSVAYYNLSLLEHGFYHYNSALRDAEDSIRSTDRASGHLARGELYLSRLDFHQALAEYERAEARDATPLTKINLATLYSEFGYLELARRYAEEVLRSEDLAWMYYYGTDLDRHLKDVHEILADAYEGLARIEARRPAGWWARLGSLLRAAGLRLRGYYHRQKFRIYSLRVGRAYLQEGNLLDANWEFFQAGEPYRNMALKYLRRAKEIEVAVSPHAEAFYLLEEGRLLRSRRLLERALQSFDPFWERQAIHKTLRSLVPLLGRNTVEGREAISRLYALNAGGLLQYGLAIPLVVELRAGPGIPPRVLQRVVGHLRRSGSQLSFGEVAPGYRYRLVLQPEAEQRLLVLLQEVDGEQTVLRETVTARPGPGRAAGLARGVLEKLYEAR
jgi:tetratricopeptide (TPR) repeat protein